MSLRIQMNLDLAAGVENSLANKIFGGNGILNELLDTLEHGTSSTYRISAGASEQLDFGDVSEGRYLYLEGDGEFSVAFAAMLATSAIIDGAAGTYPTVFAGGEKLDIEVDGLVVNVVFDVADQTRDECVARINFVAALAHAAFVAQPVAFPEGAQLRLKSPTDGPASEVKVLATSDAAALTALGLAVSAVTGDAAEPGTTDVRVERAADPSGSSAAFGLKAYMLGTIRATAITVKSLMPVGDLNLTAFIAGDLVTTP